MNKDLQAAQRMLDRGYTCVLCKGEQFRTCERRGIRPVVELLESGEDFRGFSAADKVVGRATAYLYVLLGVRGVYAHVMTQAAWQILETAGIEAYSDVLAEQICNRTRTGLCPMESACADVNTPREALAAVKRTLEQLSQK